LLVDLETEVSKFKGLNKGHLVVAGNTAPGVKMLPFAIADFKQHHPEAEILLKVSRSDQVERWLLVNDIDVAVILRDPKSAQLRKEHLCDEGRVLVLPPKHPLAKKAHVSLNDLANQHMLVPESGNLKLVVERIFSEKRLSVQQTTFGNHEAIITAISCGVGMSILSQSMVERHAVNRAVAIKTIERINLKSPVHIVLSQTQASLSIRTGFSRPSPSFVKLSQPFSL
jgi:DNA-binding transcriptional LysR family regulator